MTKLIYVLFVLLGISCHSKSTEKPLNDPTGSLAKEQPTGTSEIDFVKSSPDKAKVLLENEYVRVIEYSLKPGEKDNLHTHPPKTSYIISGGLLRVFPENEEPFDA